MTASLPSAGRTSDDDVLSAQRTFRVLLDALARPGIVRTLPDCPADVPADVDPYLALVAFTLLDQEVRFATAGPRADSAAAYIAARTGARSAPVDEADFLFASGDDPAAPLDRLRVGSAEFPEQGGTAVLAVARLWAGHVPPPGEDESGAAGLTLSGPGIAGAATVHARGLAPEVVEAFVAQNREYPLGIDAFLIDPHGGVLGLPRTVRIA